MRLIAAACAGFLLAVLWMDLIFDAQVLRHRGAEALPEPVLDSIAGYYHRATTTSRPMSLLIALVMVILLGSLAIEATDGQRSGGLLSTRAVLAVLPTGSRRTVRDAVRLVARTDVVREQRGGPFGLSRSHRVLRQHGRVPLRATALPPP